jgi:rhodanese-related sulfurtransferase
VTYCACPTEGGALRAARLLLKHEFKASVLKGGWNAWREAKGPVERK